MFRAFVLVASAAFTLLLALPASAQDPTGDPPTDPLEVPSEAQPGPWKPVIPKPEKFDWIQLKSGEWLKGEIDRLRDEVLYFDSDELNDLELDWDDVVQVRTAKPHTYRFETKDPENLYDSLRNRDDYKPVVLTGVAQIDKESVRIEVDGEVQVFPRKQLTAMVAGDGTTERQYWSGKLSLGATLRSGNANQTDVSGFFNLRRRTALTRLRFDYNGAVGTVDDVSNVDTHSASAGFDYFLTRRFYLRPIFLEFFRDPFKNIQWRLTPGLGLGYTVVDRKKLDVDVDLGFGYQRTEFVSLPTCNLGGSLAEIAACVRQASVPTSSGAGLFGVRFTSKPLTRLDFDGSYRFQIGVPNTEDIQHNLQLVLSLDVWRELDLDVSFNWDRVENPVPDEDGVTPLQDDFRLAVGIGWDF